MTDYEIKAKELIKQFSRFAHWDDGSSNNDFNSINCAIIAVDEILKNINATILYHKDSKALPINKEYWLQVLAYLNAL